MERKKEINKQINLRKICHIEGHESPASWMKTDQQQGTRHHEISEQVRTRGDPTTCKEK